MLRYTRLEHRFVQFIPEQLDPGVIYISMEYATAVHSCCCGCGEQVVTPFTPTDWKLTFDGETISLWPSIGNWSFPCRSHYIIKRSRILGADPWEDEQIARGRRRDKRAKEIQFGEKSRCETGDVTGEVGPPNNGGLGLWDRVKKKIRKRRQ